jgi:signal transduction histidine kinase
MRRVLTLIGILGCLEIALCQSNEPVLLDALGKTSQSQHDSIYYELFKVLLISDNNKAKQYALKSYMNARAYNHVVRMAKACRALAHSYNVAHDLDSSKYYYKTGIRLCKDHGINDILMNLNNEFGIFFENQDFYDSALKYYNEALVIAMNSGAKNVQAIVYNNIGLIFYYLNDFKEAERSFLQSLDVKRKNDLTKDIPGTLTNLALLYNDDRRYDLALEALREVDLLCQDGCLPKVETLFNYGMGFSYFGRGELSKALPYFNKSLELSLLHNDKKTLASTYYYLSFFSKAKSEYDEALDMLKKAEKISYEINLRRQRRDVYEEIKSIYVELGDLNNVVEYQNKYIALKDSIFNEKLANNLKDIQLDAQARQSTIIIQEKESQLQRSRVVLLLVGIILTLTLIVSFLIYRNFKTNQRVKAFLEKEIKKRTAELVKTNTDLTQMTQEYDQLVYRASHDIRGPLATLLGLTNVAKQDFNEPERVRDYLNKIGNTAQGLSQTLSQLMETNRIRNMPICLEEVELTNLVDERYNSFKTMNHFPLISLRKEKMDWSEPLITDKNLLGFILTKLLDNAFKYFSPAADNKYIKISWTQQKGETTLAVEDNGVGIDAKAREKIFQLFYVASDVHGTGLGLFLAQLAANRLGGRIILARSSGPTIFKLVINSNLAKAASEEPPVMAVAK